jgi:hypothetical protein
MMKQGKTLPSTLTHAAYEKFIPNSLEEEVEENKQMLQKLYQTHRNNNATDIDAIIDNKLSASPFFRTYVWEMRVAGMSEGLTNSKQVKRVQVGVGWKGVSVLTLNEHRVFSCSWADCSLTLGTAGLRVSTEKESITLKGLQLYETYSLCREYKGLV